MNANPLNYVRGLIDGLRGAADRETKSTFVKELTAWLPHLREFVAPDEHAELKAETITAAESLLPKTTAK